MELTYKLKLTLALYACFSGCEAPIFMIFGSISIFLRSPEPLSGSVVGPKGSRKSFTAYYFERSNTLYFWGGGGQVAQNMPSTHVAKAARGLDCQINTREEPIHDMAKFQYVCVLTRFTPG